MPPTPGSAHGLLPDFGPDQMLNSPPVVTSAASQHHQVLTSSWTEVLGGCWSLLDSDDAVKVSAAVSFLLQLATPLCLYDSCRINRRPPAAAAPQDRQVQEARAASRLHRTFVSDPSCAALSLSGPRRNVDGKTSSGNHKLQTDRDGREELQLVDTPNR